MKKLWTFLGKMKVVLKFLTLNEFSLKPDHLSILWVIMQSNQITYNGLMEYVLCGDEKSYNTIMVWPFSGYKSRGWRVELQVGSGGEF